MIRELRTCWALLLCCACSSSVPGNSPESHGGNGGSVSDRSAEAGDANAEGVAGSGATSGTSGEAGQAGASEPDGAGGIQSSAGGPSGSDGGRSSGSGGTGAAGGGGALLGSCPNVDSECGGDIKGMWAVTGICVDVRSVESGPLAGCEGISYRLTGTGVSITFAADKNFEQAVPGAEFSGVFDIPKACTSAGSCSSASADLGTLKNASTETKGDVCEVTGTLDNDPDTNSGPYVVDGNTLIVDGKTDHPMTFCVTGNTLVLKEVAARQVVVQTLVRK